MKHDSITIIAMVADINIPILVLKQLLDSIPTNNRKLAYGMLSLAHFDITCGNQICLVQYSFLEEYIENRNFAIDWSIRLFTASEHEERLKRAERRVYGVCKGFLELREPPARTTYPNMLGGVVRLIHRSIAEFLESQHFKAKMEYVLKAFDPVDAFCQTYLGQLKRIRLPMSYFSPKASSRDSPDSWGYNIEDNRNNLFLYPPHPTFRQDILWIVRRQDNCGRHWDRSCFRQFIDDTYRTVASLGTRLCVLRVPYDGRVIKYLPENVIIIICILIGAYESLPLGEDANSELVDLCTSLCLYGIGRSELKNWDQTFDAIRALQTLFDRGASPDSKLGRGIAPEFHRLLATWCSGYYPAFAAVTPSLAVVALMLYHGVNPRFAIVINRNGYKSNTEIAPIDYYLKVQFKSECPSIHSGNKVEKMRPRRAYNPLLGASPQTLRIIGNHGYVIDLRALVSIWFPDQSHILQHVIDYILELGVLTNEHHRLELQTRLGPLLRPLFDQDHPDFVGEVPPQAEWPQTSITWVRRKLEYFHRISRIEEAEWRKLLEVEGKTVTII